MKGLLRTVALQQWSIADQQPAPRPLKDQPTTGDVKKKSLSRVKLHSSARHRADSSSLLIDSKAAANAAPNFSL
jgi:hypothetical protein